MRTIFILLLFIVRQLIRADDEQGEWNFPESCSGYACDYRAQWWYLEKTDEIKFVISTKFRNKWSGIGFSDGKQMKGTDAVIGLVEENGRYFLMDTFLSGYQAPPLDAVQNIHNMTVWRENGITYLQFHRFRTTSDPEYDFQFTDNHCAYFHFVVRGGVFNAVNKRMRKHEEIPIVSKDKICIRSNDPKKHKKDDVKPSVRFNVPNKPKIPNRFKARPKLTNLITTSTSTTSTTISSLINFEVSEQINSRKPIEQPTTLPADLNNNNLKDKSIDKKLEKLIERSNDQITKPIKPNEIDSVKISITQSSTQQPSIVNTEPSSVSSLNVNQNIDTNIQNNHNNQNSKLQDTVSNSIETNNNKLNEPKNEDKLEYGEEDEETKEITNSTNENLNVNKKSTIFNNSISLSDDKSKPNKKDGRISADRNNHDETKSMLKLFNFDLKILNDNAIELNSTVVYQEAEKELSDLTGFKQLKLIKFKPNANNYTKNTDTNKKDFKPKNWIVDFEMQVQIEPDTNESDYLAYLQNSLNETVASGRIGNLILDTSHYALLKQEFNQTKEPEVKYIFEYNFFNQLTVKLTKEQLKLAYIVLGVSLLILLVLMQACCMCCSANKSNSNVHKQNNLSNSSTLQDKHHLNMHHHAQYNPDYLKNCGNNYSYENFALDTSDINPDCYDMTSYKKKNKHSISRHDPMVYNNYHQNYSNGYNQNYSNSYNRRPDFGYNYNNGNFNNYSNHHHGSSSHLRYFEPQPMHSLEPDFYFMPKQRINHKCYN